MIVFPKELTGLLWQEIERQTLVTIVHYYSFCTGGVPGLGYLGHCLWRADDGSREHVFKPDQWTR